jgi:small subunit ribosomal protein S6
MFIIDPTVPDEGVESIVGQMEGVIKDGGGTIDKTDRWGKRKLAYRVKKRDEGFYVLIQFSAGADVVKEIGRRLKVHEQVLKYLTVRIDEKLQWLEKRKKEREKRAQRKAAAAPAGPGFRLPGEPPPAMPGEPPAHKPERSPEHNG